MAALVPLKPTLIAPVKFVPIMVSFIPDPEQALVGENELITGACAFIICHEAINKDSTNKLLLHFRVNILMFF
jgi:hypothetical protein